MKAKFIALTIALSTFFMLHTFAQNINIVGTWKLVGQKVINPDGSVLTTDSAHLNQIKMYTPTMYVVVGEVKVPQLDNKKMVNNCAGGHYTINGDVYQEFTEFASWKGYKDMKVKFKLTMEKGKMHTVGSLSGSDGAVTIYDEWYTKVEVPAQSKELVGTWKATSQKVTRPDGGVLTTDSSSLNMRKIFTPGMVVVVQERVIPQQDNQKLVVSCAGGLYTLNSGVYSEMISFGSYKDFDSGTVKFNLKIENGKLHTFGTITHVSGQVAIYDEWYVKQD
ncbi:hypothetical protein ACXZ1K_07910 [Pedobacter sp. PWIIR3]